MSSALRAWARTLAVAGCVLALDQISKAIVRASLEPGERNESLPVLDLVHVRNDGVAFGALAGGGAAIVALVVAAMIVLSVYFARHTAVPLLWLPVGAVFGGALGNLADRARDGTVIDFIDPIAWPAFNLADTAVVLGVLGVFYVAEGQSQPTHGDRG